MILEVAPGDVDLARLTELQAAAARGSFAAAMAGYVQWLAGQLDTLQAEFPARLASLRTELTGAGMHARTPDALANLAYGWRCWLRFAEDVGALTKAEGEAAWQRAWAALCVVARGQPEQQGSEAPARRFIELVRAALASGDAHVAAPHGDAPARAEPWGWRARTFGTGDNERTEWEPEGKASRLIGWLDGDDLFLEPEAAFAAALRLGQQTGSALTVQPRTLTKRLYQAGLVQSTERDTRGTLTVRRTLAGARRDTLHLAATTLMPRESDQSDQSDQGDGESPPQQGIPVPSGRVWWSESAEPEAEPDHGIRPNPPDSRGDGRIGRIGQVFLAHELDDVTAGGGNAANVTPTCLYPGCGVSLPPDRHYYCPAHSKKEVA